MSTTIKHPVSFDVFCSSSGDLPDLSIEAMQTRYESYTHACEDGNYPQHILDILLESACDPSTDVDPYSKPADYETTVTAEFSLSATPHGEVKMTANTYDIAGVVVSGVLPCGYRLLGPNDDPYEGIEFVSQDIELKDYTGKVIFSQKDAEFPSTYTDNTRQVIANKYFYGPRNTPQRERSMKQLVGRVVGRLSGWGQDQKYFSQPDERKRFENSLKFITMGQYAFFNSPVWFNLGTPEKQQASACFINGLADSMESICELQRTEMMVFKGGSGAGNNVSNLRGKGEPLNGGGTSSGPLSFMRGFDQNAGSIKSGGKTRRAAKMVVMDIDHPDIREFIACKGLEEKKAQALISAGYDASFDSDDGAYATVAFQNANHSVCVTDEFMRLAATDGNFKLRWRTNPEMGEVVRADNLLEQIARATWESGDPGLHFWDEIQKWHTCPEDGAIRASNPCSEYLHLDDTSCNLASLNLYKFIIWDGDRAVAFDYAAYLEVCAIMATALDIIIEPAHYPTDKIGEETRKSRTIGLGYTNLGAVLMAFGHAYDSEEARYFAATLTHVMNAAAYMTSADLCEQGGLAPFERLDRNRVHMAKVLDMHSDAFRATLAEGARHTHARDVGVLHRLALDFSVMVAAVRNGAGLRNAQATVLAPTGTISFAMGCDTTGVEPVISLVTYKQLVGGGSMTLALNCVKSALLNLGYNAEQAEAWNTIISETGSIASIPFTYGRHKAVFATSFGADKDNLISTEGHIHMMAAVQPALSGAISKTINMPNSATVDDVRAAITMGHKAGLKAMAIYRDGSKGSQPLTSKDTDDVSPEEENATVSGATFRSDGEKVLTREAYNAMMPAGVILGKAALPDLPELKHGERRSLPDTRPSTTHKFTINGQTGYINVGVDSRGNPRELFVSFSKMGSTVRGFVDSFAIVFSLALQYGAPIDVLIRKLKHTQFEPSGFTNNKDIRNASSIPDYIVRWLELEYITKPEQELEDMKSRVRGARGYAFGTTLAPTGVSGAAAPMSAEDWIGSPESAEIRTFLTACSTALNLPPQQAAMCSFIMDEDDNIVLMVPGIGDVPPRTVALSESILEAITPLLAAEPAPDGSLMASPAKRWSPATGKDHRGKTVKVVSGETCGICGGQLVSTGPCLSCPRCGETFGGCG